MFLKVERASGGGRIGEMKDVSRWIVECINIVGRERRGENERRAKLSVENIHCHSPLISGFFPPKALILV